MKSMKASYEILTPIDGVKELQHIEKIGRVCYKSEDKITEDGESAKKFVRMLIKNEHCYDMDTEILTLHGWKKYGDLLPDDLFATIDDSGCVHYKPAIRTVKKWYSGGAVKVTSRFVDLLVTDKHKMYTCQTTTKNGRSKDAYSLIEADKLINTSHAYLKNSVNFAGIDGDGCKISLSVLKLLGFSIGDGSIDKINLTFHIPNGRKTEYLTRICEDIGVKISKYNSNDEFNRFRISINDSAIAEYADFFLGMYNPNREKKIPNWLLEKMNMEECRAMLDGLQESDGHVTKNKSSYYSTTSEELKNQFQQLCLHAGYSSDRGIDLDQSKIDTGFNSKGIITKMSVIKRYNKPEINKGKSSIGVIEKIDDWNGDVWCVTVPPYNNVYVKRNGKPVWCGNCAMIEHSSLSVKFTVDRGVSHELVRHRIASFAQESTRYCNYSNDKFDSECTFIDLSCGVNYDAKMAQMTAEQIEAVLNEWENACKDAEVHYLKMLELGATPQIARSVLPNSTKTEITITANFREWRNFFKLRVPKTAHPQMREVTNPLLRELQAKLPDVFGDIEVES